MNSFSYINKTYQYIIERKDVKNVNLRVTPNLEIYVSANDNVSDEEIHSFVRSKARWIVKHLNMYESVKSKSTKKEFVSG